MKNRKHSIRSLVRSLLVPKDRPAATRPLLAMTTLEDRVVPASLDVSGLRFEIPGTFNSAPFSDGTKYDTTEPISVGVVPTGGNPFVPLISLADGGFIQDVTNNILDQVGWTNRVQALTSGSPLEILAGAASQQISNTIPGDTSFTSHSKLGKAVGLDSYSYQVVGFRFLDAAKVGLAGSFETAEFGGIKVNGILDAITTAPTAVAAFFAKPSFDTSFQLAPGSTSFNVGGLAFTAKTNAKFPTLGGVIRFTPASKTLEIAGQAAFNLPQGTVSVSSGTYDIFDASKFSPGVTIVNGSITKFDLAVTSDLKLGGLTFTTKALQGTYDSANSTFTLKGGTGFAFKGNTVNVDFGDAGTAGLTIVGGSVTQAAFEVESQIKVGGLTFGTKALAATYEAATSTYTIKGTTFFDFKGNTVDVAWGDKGTPGLVIENGNLKSLAFAVTSAVKVGKLDFTTKDLAFTYDDPTSTFTMKGNAKVSIASNFVDVNFGDDSTSGLVIVNGSLQSLNFAVNSSAKIGGLTIRTDDLRATYDDPSSTFTLTGKADFEVKSAKIGIVLGSPTTKGIVITNGSVASIDATVDSSFKFSNVTFTTTNLRFTHEANGARYTITGDAKVTFKIKGQDNNLEVKFGAPGAPRPRH